MNDNEFSKRAIRHGECLLKAIDELPENLTEIKGDGKEVVVAHSETGHSHIAVGTVKAFRDADNNLFLKVGKQSRLEHKKTFDKHETKTLFPGLYAVILKKEWDYFAKKIREVRD